MNAITSKQTGVSWSTGATCLVCITALTLPAAAQRPGPAPVVAAPVVQGKVRATINVVGTIMPETECTVASEISGAVRELAVNQGDYVKEGQILCRVKDTELRLLLAEVQAKLEAMRQALAELEAGTRKEDIDRLQAAVKEAKAVKDKWDKERARVEGLYKEGTASIKEYQDTIYDSIAADQRVAQFQADLAKAIAGPRKEQIARARAEVDAQKAVVEQIKDKISKTQIRAPYSGYVIAKRTEVGEWLNLGGPVVDMLAMDRVLARVDIPEKAIVFAKPGDRAEVWIDALQRRFPGKLVHIIPQGDPSARTFPVEIEIANADRIIKPGMFVRAKLPAGPEIDSLIVPKDALVRLGPTRVIYVIRNQLAVAEFVQTGLEQQDRISISGNIKPGELVVIRGNERLVPGRPQPVAVQNVRQFSGPTKASPNAEQPESKAKKAEK